MVAAYVDAIRTTPEDTTSHQGGKVFTTDIWTRLARFLILGSAGGSFYASERDLTAKNVDVVAQCLDTDYRETIDAIVQISQDGRAVKNEPAILALAMASVHSNPEVRKAAYGALKPVCRTGTHLLHFISYREALGGGWGRGMRNAVEFWLSSFSPRQLAYQASKYQQRDGWALRDVVRLAHPTVTWNHDPVIRYILGQSYADMTVDAETLAYLDACRFVAREDLNECVVADTILGFKLPREVVNTQYLNSKLVWEALLKDMPAHAMLRNLGKMAAVGVLDLGSYGEGQVTHAFGSVERLRKARMHPLAILQAMMAYQNGHGLRGKLSWMPNKRILNVLDEAFYMAFKTIEPSGKRIRLAVDVSGSMSTAIANMMPITCRIAAAAMTLVTVATEPNTDVVAYSDKMVPVKISPNMRLDQVVRELDRILYGGTICSLPIMDAIQSRSFDIDAFVSYTDSETMNGWTGRVYRPSTVWTPSGRGYYDTVEIPTVEQCLKQYRSRSGRNTANVVVGMVANDISIANPHDPRQLDVVGFDTAAPAVISDFIAGRL